MQVPKDRGVAVDCDAGRRMGCRTYCCHLLVRLDPDEILPVTDPVDPPRRHLEKRPDGSCVYLDPETHQCRIWERRPRQCREFDCNDDFKLQVVLKEGFTSLVGLVKRAQRVVVPKETYRRVPGRGKDPSEQNPPDESS